MNNGIEKNGADLCPTYNLLRATKIKPREIRFKKDSQERMDRWTCGPKDNVISLKETSVRESPNKGVLSHFLTPPSFPKNLTDAKTLEDAMK